MEVKCPKCGKTDKVEFWGGGTDFRNPSEWYVCHRCRTAFAVNEDYYDDWEREH
jgi:DNA-directed RNA polymerase subunit RPC12/RpoP